MAGLDPAIHRFDLVIPGCALLGADPESSTVHCSGFRVRAEEARPGMTVYGWIRGS
ncbi:MAG: hypothetical protein QOD09_1130, partial [Bradyrhizobium sp.]|nr:hypothetical protein [Bradyrhizobium sp.]